jgi:hypothetical protein
MRRRALLFALAAGGFAAVGGAAAGVGAIASHDPSESAIALTRTELADVPAPTVFARARDTLGRERDVQHDAAVALAITTALTLAGGWWLARQGTAHIGNTLAVARPRPRAPPVRVPTVVHY